jgi:hypothetical protein
MVAQYDQWPPMETDFVATPVPVFGGHMNALGQEVTHPLQILYGGEPVPDAFVTVNIVGMESMAPVGPTDASGSLVLALPQGTPSGIPLPVMVDARGLNKQFQTEVVLAEPGTPSVIDLKALEPPPAEEPGIPWTPYIVLGVLIVGIGVLLHYKK